MKSLEFQQKTLFDGLPDTVYLRMDAIREIQITQNEGLHVWTKSGECYTFPCTKQAGTQFFARLVHWENTEESDTLDVPRTLAAIARKIEEEETVNRL